MEAKKVYESITQVSNNVIKHEMLRYQLTKNVEFRNMFIAQVNNMLALENDHNQTYNDVAWAAIFGKAIVKILGSKQRFEKPENKSIDDIYADYSAFISFTTKTFEVGRNELVENKVKFTEQDVMFNAVMDDTIKAKYLEIEADRKAEEAKAKADEEKSKQTSSQQTNNQQQFNQNPFEGANMFANMPVHPMQDPRFYPYNAKSKWMPLAKKIFAVFAIIISAFLIATMAILMTTKMDLSNMSSNWVSTWTDGWANHLADAYKESYKDWNWTVRLAGVSWTTIISFFFYVIPPIYLSFDAFRKPRNMREKYRISVWPLAFAVIFYVFAIIDMISYIDTKHIKDSLLVMITTLTKVADGETADKEGFWTEVMNQYGNKLTMATTMVQVGVGLLSVGAVAAIALFIVNPKLDRNKVAFANMEFQKAAAAMMQGQHYEMDPSLYENDSEVINSKDGKFKKWFKKTFKSKSKNKD